MNEWSDIGGQLQEAREKRGLALEDVARETRIPQATLQALEENDYSSFTSPAYTKSFLRQYSEFLEIDAHEITDSLEAGHVLAQSEGNVYLDQEKSPSPGKGHTSQQTKAPQGNLAQPLLIFAISAGVIALGIWVFFAIEKQADHDPGPIRKTSDLIPPKPDPKQEDDSSNEVE